MSNRRLPIYLAALAALSLGSPSFAAKADAGKELTPDLAAKLTSLPYGIANQKSVGVRFKHVESVQFDGAGKNSLFSFKRGDSVIPEGLNLVFRQRGQLNWATGTVQFKTPIDLSRYDSMVVWVYANKPNLRFAVALQSPNADGSNPAWETKTNPIPSQGFPAKEAVQMVIPFARIDQRKNLDLKNVSRIKFEFGEDATGNSSTGVIEVYGIAFVSQTWPLKQVQVVFNRAKPTIASAESAKTLAVEGEKVVAPPPQALPEKPQVQTPKAIALRFMSRTVASLLRMSDAETAQFFKKMGLTWNSPTKEKFLGEHEPEVRESYENKLVSSYSRKWPMGGPVYSDPTDSFEFNIGAGDIWLVLMTGVLIALIVVMRRQRKIMALSKVTRVVHEVRWPFMLADSIDGSKMEKEFWKEIAGQQARFAWLSVKGITVEKCPDNEYYGESFLKRQVLLARKAGVKLFPSFSFARTAFRYDSFLTNPRLFHVKTVAAADKNVSDEELLARDKGYFPVWIPPFWQRHYEMPARVLVEYGKTGDAVPSKENVQYNLTSADLRVVTIETVERVAQTASGIRIEDATSLLAHRMARKKKDKEADADLPEFWKDVTTRVKGKHPEFLFIADAAGDDGQALVDMGFDFFENDQLANALLKDIRAGKVSALTPILSGPSASLLKSSIYNLGELVRSTAAGEVADHQNTLAVLTAAMLPGVIQQTDTLPQDLSKFIVRLGRLSVLRKGKFALLESNSDAVLAFARWRKQTLYVAIANFSSKPVDAVVSLAALTNGLDNNKLYLFSNALHGIPAAKTGAESPAAAPEEPALAMWGQNLRDSGLPLTIPGLSLRLFSVSLSRPVINGAVPEAVEEVVPTLK